MRDNKKAYVVLRFMCSEEDRKFICRNVLFWCRKINLNGDKKTANERVDFHKAKRFALVSNYLPFQARVGSTASSPRLIALVKTF